MKQMLKAGTLLLLIASLSSCGIFKHRNVQLSVKDSTVKEHTSSTERKTTKTVDTSAVKTITTVSKTDSSYTITDIIPTIGKPFTIDANGSFHGEANHLTIKTNKLQKEKDTSTVDQKNGTSSSVIEDNTHSDDKETTVLDKNKVVDSSPDYTWIWYMLGAAAVILGAFLLYKKLVPKLYQI
jgi:hypothetical protein